MKRIDKMNGGCANWDDRTSKLFLDLCIAEKDKLNYNNKGLTKHGWSNVYRSFKELIGRSYSAKQMQNKFNTFKRQFSTWRVLQKQSGLGRDKIAGGVSAEEGWWNNDDVGSSSAAVADCGKPPAFEEELTMLFGTKGQDRSTLMCAGGVGDRTPSGGSEDTAARMSQDPIGRSSVGHLSKRASEVDSPPKKKSSSMEGYMRTISETLVARSSGEGPLSREHDEMMEVFDMLEKDGVEEGSELHFMALNVLKHSFNRKACLKMKSAENRKAYLQWTWNKSKK